VRDDRLDPVGGARRCGIGQRVDGAPPEPQPAMQMTPQPTAAAAASADG